MAAANITGSGGIKNARYIRDMDTRGIRDVPAGKNDDQASIKPRAKIGHHDLVKSRPGSRGGVRGGRGGSGCDVGVATPAIGATSTETEIQSETVTAIGSATVTGSATTVSPMTNFPGQGFADGKIAVSYAPRHPPSTSLKTRITQPADGYGSNLNVDRTPVTTSLATAPDSFASAASISGNRISTSLAISIGLATVAGLALIFAGLLFFKVCRRLRRSGRLDSDLPLDEPKRNTRKSKAAISAPSVSIPLETLPPSLSCPPASPALPTLQVNRSFRTTATFAAPAHVVRPSGEPPGLKLKDVQGGGGPWWKSCGGLEHETAGVGIGMDEVKALGQRRSNPPPMLMDRKFHPSITGSIMSSQSASADSTPRLHRGHVRGRHTPLVASNLSADWQVPILPVTAIQPPPRSVRPGATMSSTSPIQITTHECLTPPAPNTPRQSRTPGPFMGLQTPGPLPKRALPSLPPQNRHIVSSSPKAQSHAGAFCQEEIGVAVRGPSRLGITIDKPYYQVWCDASRWQPPTQSSIPEDQQRFF